VKRRTPPLIFPYLWWSDLHGEDGTFGWLVIECPDLCSGLLGVRRTAPFVLVRPWACDALKQAACVTAVLMARRIGEVLYNVANATYEEGIERGRVAWQQARREGW
jgi:hypothetical protein